ncbi:predicted protein [Plenodomus lingam JN3]|uniref:Uncharacterized protein n=1 Tax=Leptosphaeria maculans (strain JN3 / isolate v23.1.3 / race Av1-4-5-6-7-8) TaxID=985895 RepID=E4ZGY6_LEPMJ|nr:predicted protein [Plenodomus lingam JN3]CBX90556.1 predicted protein [Plenodomus lingam JN3]
MGLEWETQRLGDAGVIEGKMQVCPVRSFVTSSKWDFHGQGGWSMKALCSQTSKRPPTWTTSTCSRYPNPAFPSPDTRWISRGSMFGAALVPAATRLARSRLLERLPACQHAKTRRNKTKAKNLEILGSQPSARQSSPQYLPCWVDAIVAHVVLAYRVIGLENDANR